MINAERNDYEKNDTYSKSRDETFSQSQFLMANRLVPEKESLGTVSSIAIREDCWLISLPRLVFILEGYHNVIQR